MNPSPLKMLLRSSFPVLLFAMASAVPPASAAEDYKTVKSTSAFTLGIASGFGLVDSYGGLAVVPSVSARIVENGFIPEIVNPVFIELQFGPLFTGGGTIWMHSTHLRWDFIKDSQWTLFALGGIAGNFMDNRLGNRSEFYPRFGVGVFYQLTDILAIRADFSHELITVGVSVPF